MDAMLLAAGLGTRLRPLTDRMPKALVEVGGVPMLERVARRVIAAGADRLIINTYAFADQVEAFVARRGGFGVDVVFSREPDRPLETGGALVLASPLFRRDAPFFLHNTDVLADFDLAAMYAAHVAGGALATLAVDERETSRYLLFDDDGLYGHLNVATGASREVRAPRGKARRYGFCGAHVLDPAVLDLITERGAFSIIDPYLRLAGEGCRIAPFPIGDALWMDIGSPERLKAARAAVAEDDSA